MCIVFLHHLPIHHFYKQALSSGYLVSMVLRSVSRLFGVKQKVIQLALVKMSSFKMYLMLKYL